MPHFATFMVKRENAEDIARFACNSLAPAVVSKVYVDEDNRSMEIVVADDQLSLAIGKRVQNVRLAARLTGWRIDIKSETRVAEAELLQFSSYDGTKEEEAEEESAEGVEQQVPVAVEATEE